MIQFDVSLWPVLLAAVVNIVLGFLWYGPIFGKKWMKAAKVTKEEIEEKKKKGVAKTYTKSFVGALVMAYILSVVIVSMAISTFLAGAMVGLLVWFGFLMPVGMQNLLWEKNGKEVFKINAGYNLTALMIMGALLAIWL